MQTNKQRLAVNRFRAIKQWIQTRNRRTQTQLKAIKSAAENLLL
jgi:hypothetical protein